MQRDPGRFVLLSPRLMLFSLLVAFPLVLAGCRGSAPREGTQLLTGTQIAERTTPATVEVLSRFEAAGDVDELEPDVDKLIYAVREQSPAGVTKEEAIIKLADLLYNDPARYMKLGGRRHLTRSIYSLGTGFIVSPDGYILSNAHVVEPEDEDLKKAVVASVADLVGEDASQIEHSVESLLPGRSIKAEASDRLKTVLAEEYAKRSSFTFNRQVHILMPTAHGDNHVQELECEVKRVGVPTPGKDIAVLKIDGSDLPTVPLARSLTSGSVEMGADLYVIGYPGSVALFPSFNPGTTVEPSLTFGHVSNIKQMSGGFQVIQTDAAINPGNSGGPVLNAYGEVVGLATFKLKDSEGVNFAVSIDLARQFLNDLNITPRQSEFTRQFDAALLQYDRPGHGRALHMFKALSESHPGLSAPRSFVHDLGGSVPETGSTETASADAANRDAAGREHAPARPEHLAQATPEHTQRRGFPGFLLVIVAVLLVGGLIALIATSRR